MQRFKRIQSQVLDIVDENIKLHEKIKVLESTKKGKEISKEYEALLYLSTLEVKKLFEYETKYGYKNKNLIQYDENGASLSLRSWLKIVIENVDDGFMPTLKYMFSTQELIDFCISLKVEDVYNQEVENAKMEYVRSHKEE